MALRFSLNGKPAEFAGDPTMPMLWYLRDHAGLTGSKFGCGAGLCGACEDRGQVQFGKLAFAARRRS